MEDGTIRKGEGNIVYLKGEYKIERSRTSRKRGMIEQ